MKPDKTNKDQRKKKTRAAFFALFGAIFFGGVAAVCLWLINWKTQSYKSTVNNTQGESNKDHIDNINPSDYGNNVIGFTTDLTGNNDGSNVWNSLSNAQILNCVLTNQSAMLLNANQIPAFTTIGTQLDTASFTILNTSKTALTSADFSISCDGLFPTTSSYSNYQNNTISQISSVASNNNITFSYQNLTTTQLDALSDWMNKNATITVSDTKNDLQTVTVSFNITALPTSTTYDNVNFDDSVGLALLYCGFNLKINKSFSNITNLGANSELFIFSGSENSNGVSNLYNDPATIVVFGNLVDDSNMTYNLTTQAYVYNRSYFPASWIAQVVNVTGYGGTFTLDPQFSPQEAFITNDDSFSALGFGGSDANSTLADFGYSITNVKYEYSKQLSSATISGKTLTFSDSDVLSQNAVTLYGSAGVPTSNYIIANITVSDGSGSFTMSDLILFNLNFQNE